MMKISLFLVGILLVTLGSHIAQAQTNPSGLQGNTTPNLDNFAPNQFDDVQPVGQPDLGIDSNNSSQQFFRQNNDQLYFLPESKSEPILKIDETVEAEGIDYEDLQQQPSNKK
jgi:hypothetical protein